MKKRIRLSSFSPGRVRLRFEPEHEADLSLQALFEIPTIHELSFRKFTGSLLILYDAGRINLKELINSIENKRPDWNIETPSEWEFDKEYPRDLVLGRFFYYTDRLDREIHRQTSGNLDLKTTLILIYLTLGMWEFLRKPVHPKWYDIIKEATGVLRDYQRIYEA